MPDATVMREQKDAEQPSKTAARVFWATLAGAWLVCVMICFAVLRHFTGLSTLACLLLAIPASIGLFYLCIQMAEHG